MRCLASRLSYQFDKVPSFKGRAERKIDQVCSKTTYGRVFKAIAALPKGVKQLVMQLGIPIAYPRMNFVEKVLCVHPVSGDERTALAIARCP